MGTFARYMHDGQIDIQENGRAELEIKIKLNRGCAVGIRGQTATFTGRTGSQALRNVRTRHVFEHWWRLKAMANDPLTYGDCGAGRRFINI